MVFQRILLKIPKQLFPRATENIYHYSYPLPKDVCKKAVVKNVKNSWENIWDGVFFVKILDLFNGFTKKWTSGDYLWILENFSNYLFWRISVNECFCNIYFSLCYLSLQRQIKSFIYQAKNLPGVVLFFPHNSIHFSLATGLSQSCGVNSANSLQYIFVL